ncbi:hypothetical protein IB238_01680 [Rhizobium sp. ARZ01]|uniref:hypothetical protein n=1 Tax=Rhizobium sp. ARZ01 TaxID=2769313 RepID=UPI00177F994A|nr:hypothetical protein [Rhizobium sp. ARZ01]MBD9371349.1 hypothetical protein [Rhizobium sp. ARZ01]
MTATTVQLARASLAATSSHQAEDSLPEALRVDALLLPRRKDGLRRYRLEFLGEVLNELTSLPGPMARDILTRRGHVGWVEITFDDGRPSSRMWAGDVRLRPFSDG